MIACSLFMFLFRCLLFRGFWFYYENIMFHDCMLFVYVPFSLSAFQGDGALLATGSYDGQARIWNTYGMY